MIKAINQVIVFAIELIMIGAFAYAGFQKGNSRLVKYSLAFIFPLVIVLLWGYFAAPKSSHRLRMPYLAIFRLTLFLSAAYLLYKCGQNLAAVVTATLSILTQLASYFLND